MSKKCRKKLIFKKKKKVPFGGTSPFFLKNIAFLVRHPEKNTF